MADWYMNPEIHDEDYEEMVDLLAALGADDAE